ncbi:MAG TPA: hypothetical protein VEC10_07510, partial [Steroidobacteraceae bacterium]|nr:hypothetical protein [Steroidobacteraceae bacterium]
MNHTLAAPLGRPRLSSLLPLLLVGALSASSAARAAGDSEAAQLSTLQQQLGQVQAALKQLAEENRALREHQEQLDRKLAEMSAGG